MTEKLKFVVNESEQNRRLSSWLSREKINTIPFSFHEKQQGVNFVSGLQLLALSAFVILYNIAAEVLPHYVCI